MPDLVVIGAGLTGLVAALTAVETGLTVRVIAKGMGALHWSAGTIDILGYRPDNTPVDSPLSEIGKLDAPHPYALVDADSVAESLSWFRIQAAAGGVRCERPADNDSNIWLPSPVGALRPAYLVPSAQAPGDIRQDMPMVVVGLDRMRDFYPQLIASNLCKQGIKARAATIPIESITDRSDYNTVHLAKALDEPETRGRVGQHLRTVVSPGERIGMPAILGYTDHEAAIAEVSQVADAPVFEIPTLPPSIPGIRLHRALCQQLAMRNVRVETGMEVISICADDNRIRWVETETSSRPLRHSAAAFLLATGGVLGGGFSGDVKGNFKEDIFDLPLSAPLRRSEWFRSEFLDPAGQPIFEAGVKVNSSMQPVGANGEVAYSNLWAAGGLLAHADAIRERSLEGVAITTGRYAAQTLIAELHKTETHI